MTGHIRSCDAKHEDGDLSKSFLANSSSATRSEQKTLQYDTVCTNIDFHIPDAPQNKQQEKRQPQLSGLGPLMAIEATPATAPASSLRTRSIFGDLFFLVRKGYALIRVIYLDSQSYGFSTPRDSDCKHLHLYTARKFIERVQL